MAYSLGEKSMDIVRAALERSGAKIPQSVAARFYRGILDQLADEIVEKGRLELRGLGTFSITPTGQVRFRPVASVKDRMIAKRNTHKIG